MPSGRPDPLIPRSVDDLNELHVELESAFETGLRRVCDALTLVFGDEAGTAVVRALLLALATPNNRPEVDALITEAGWREVLPDLGGSATDVSFYTQVWIDGAMYGGQGIAPFHPSTLEERERRIRELLNVAPSYRTCASVFVGDRFDYLWEGVAARAAIDFGGSVSLAGLRLLSDLPLTAVRNAVSTGDLHPNADGSVTAEEARAWLQRRRDFCPSRWRNPADDQYPFDPQRIITPDANGLVLVPQAAEGDIFAPDRVVRPARSGSGISVTIGAKGEEVQYGDFYDALKALAAMEVARWRRRNSAGNWGIVRARGAWVAVSKAEIDRQLTVKLAEAS